VAAVRVATFNVENLFARFRFNSDVDPEKAVKDGWDANKTYFRIFDEDEKRITGKLIRSLDAEVLALQEVESLDTLRRFRGDYAGGPKAFPYTVLVDGNDPRLIDVAVMSKHPIVSVRSNQHLRSGKAYLFSRDCLEVELDIGGAPLHLFVNHFKSMLDKHDPKNGRRNTRARRQLQAKTVKEIVEARFGTQAGEHPFIVLGDLNDYLETDDAGSTGISELVGWSQVENVVERRQEGDRWTHYFRQRAAPKKDSYKQLDYLLVSKSLAAKTGSVPQIVRKGLTKAADLYTGPRFPEVGDPKPVASDHCPVVLDVAL
jgi:endonuclease/exonuclease/phosphatase family metal-dependent hydrolase